MNKNIIIIISLFGVLIIGFASFYFLYLQKDKEDIDNSPIAKFVIEPINPLVNQDILFDASQSSDPDNDKLQYRWDWENDGSWDTEFLSLESITHSYQEEGNKIVALEVKDINGNINSVTRTINVLKSDEELDNQPTENESTSTNNQSEFTVGCIGLPSETSINKNVTWTASPQGGTGVYSYIWSGSENLDGSTRSVVKKYSNSGEATATVKVVSGDQTRTASCKVLIKELSSLKVSCSALPTIQNIGETVIWTATVSGGNGFLSYSYNWSGDDELSGIKKIVQKAYSTIGEKQATVTVTSGSETVSVSCPVTIQN